MLLLDDAPPTNSPTAKMADNTRCQVCHLNLAFEEMTLTHARAEIGCAKCHGASDRHIADESWASGGTGTPPETMYPKYRIHGFCRDCHNANQRRKFNNPDALVRRRAAQSKYRLANLAAVRFKERERARERRRAA